MFIDYKTKLFAIVGKNISYTLSPAIHNFAFEKMGINGVYLAFDIKDQDKFDKGIEGILEVSEGINITIPYKEKIIPHLNSLDKSSEEIGAVNTVYKERGYNTDYIAVRKLILELSRGKVDALVLGAGGAAKAASYAIGSLGGKIYIINRTVDKARNLVSSLTRLGYDATVVKGCDLKFDLVVNATPDPSSFPSECIKGEIALDFVYHPVITPFLKMAMERGLKTIDGLRILVSQAIEAEKIWFGKSINEEEVVNYLYARKLVR
ncbi:shikimate dehydrogenase [Acidianus sp. RZ1]|uniref:Shikimate dehydrogenase (NADP(+)) n=1 Tax=Candidatus Acidianus copahuensis TaxID=1160895 RepID=A0A031LPF6_9CREN|nr:shikimate dehydrogenase [Acidianus sp. RZ1]EZQ06962.1 shikimate dehydrogenase [Candidatus Acidianus copahuensis]